MMPELLPLVQAKPLPLNYKNLFHQVSKLQRKILKIFTTLTYNTLKNQKENLTCI